MGLILVGSILLIALLEHRLSDELPYPHQVEFLDAAKWIETNLGKDETASAFNAGTVGFFSHRRVVNLDGVINNAARDAIVQGKLLHMMRTAGVRYYVDYDPWMLKLYASYLGQGADPVRMTLLQDIDRPNVSWSHSIIRAYRLDWSVP